MSGGDDKRRRRRDVERETDAPVDELEAIDDVEDDELGDANSKGVNAIGGIEDQPRPNYC